MYPHSRFTPFQYLLPCSSPLLRCHCSPHILPSSQPHQQAPVKTAQPRPYPVGGRRRTKKGPKRVKKSREQLDKEMEDYRARLDGPLDPKGNDQ